jgi:uncharacterized damage-inducible protein DinB
MDLPGVTALFRYNRWANDQVLAAVSRVPVSAFVRQIHPLPEGSIRGVLTHIVWSEWIWLQRWRGVTDLVFQPADFGRVPEALVFRSEEFAALAPLRERFRAVDRETSEYLGTLAPEDLARVVTYRTPTGASWARVLWRQLVHAVNHSTYHRGQVAVMLREGGYEPMPSDFVGFEDAG